MTVPSAYHSAVDAVASNQKCQPWNPRPICEIKFLCSVTMCINGGQKWFVRKEIELGNLLTCCSNCPGLGWSNQICKFLSFIDDKTTTFPWRP